MKYRLKEKIVEATVERYRIEYPNGVVAYMDAKEFEKDFEPVPEEPKPVAPSPSQMYIIEYRAKHEDGWTRWMRSGNRNTKGDFSSASAAFEAAINEERDMNSVAHHSRYEYRVTPKA